MGAFSRTQRSMVSGLASTQPCARSAMRSMSGRCRPSSSSSARMRPAGGPHSGSAMRATIVRSMIATASSSRSTASTDRMALATWSEASARLSSLASHSPARSGMCALRTFSLTISGSRKFSPTNSPSELPSWSFFLRINAVCGMGMRSGWRNSAVTANQSASPPTMPASAAARTYPTQGSAPLCSAYSAIR